MLDKKQGRAVSFCQDNELRPKVIAGAVVLISRRVQKSGRASALPKVAALLASKAISKNGPHHPRQFVLG